MCQCLKSLKFVSKLLIRPEIFGGNTFIFTKNHKILDYGGSDRDSIRNKNEECPPAHLQSARAKRKC